MNTHHTKLKGDIGLTATIHDLTKKGYFVFTSISENCNYDLIADVEENIYRIQVKYIGKSNRAISNRTAWSDKKGNHIKLYPENAFDFYAIYLAELDKVIYVPFREESYSTGIRTTIPNSYTPFYWWEDFLSFKKDMPNKKTILDFGIVITKKKAWNKGKEQFKARKVIRPLKEELKTLLWEEPTSTIANRFGVSDKAVEKWCKIYDIKKPPRGYWTKQKADALSK